jgi:methyl-accepting chemotaxis protein
MAETGETYLVGQDGLMRSNSRFSDESTVLRTAVETDVVALAMEGGEGVRKVIDYRGVEVLSAYAALQLGDFTWAVLAEIDRAEVEQLAAAERPALAGALGFFYGLSLWSIWYWRGRQLPGEEADMSSLALDAGDFGEGGMAG